MKRRTLKVRRLPNRLAGDPGRVIVRPFAPGPIDRVSSIADRLAKLSDQEVGRLLSKVLTSFGSRHRDIQSVLLRHYQRVQPHLDGRAPDSLARRLLIGSCVTSEYSLESVALFNPSIVEHPDQSGLAPGAVRFVMSVRACGEGHISSIEFRSGIVQPGGKIDFDPVAPTATPALPVEDRLYGREAFLQKLSEMHARHSFEQRLVGSLGETFTFDQLRAAIDGVRAQFAGIDKFDEQAKNVLWLARSNYHLDFPPESDLSERVIFPVTENESRGIEDARFVRFIEPDGRAAYYATYTAYNDVRILPQLIHTEDFLHFEIHTLNGCSAQNKGMALFPRRINGKYCMVARLDGENLFLLRSDNVYYWDEAVPLCRPTLAWEVVQIGNCGSPLETDAGWLLLTHGVGPMRQYWIGALLLDRDDPTTVLGHLEKPLLAPRASERDGYVPNVVYSCGAMIHHDTLIIPYGVADTYTRIATVPLPDLLAHLKS